MSIEVVRYSSDRAAEWDRLIDQSRNGLFLFKRGYMDYHADRFEDFSALAMVDGRALAVLPATFSRETGVATSHGGLTFGGVVIKQDVRGEVAIRLIEAMLDALRHWGASEAEFRLLPAAFTTYPSAEIDYVLWRRGFQLRRRDLSSILPLAQPLPFNSSKKQAVTKALKANLQVGVGDLNRFHALLSRVLGEQHGVSPVHSQDELQLLTGRFPDHIFLRSVERDGEMLAGALAYRYPNAWHTQYLAASPEGRQLGALDLVIATLIDEAREAGAKWFSFGTSTTNEGHQLNEGLLWQKESFGARSVTYDVMRGGL